MDLFIKLNFEGIRCNRKEREYGKCYYLDGCNMLFQYIDEFEKLIPKTCGTCWWDWGAVRIDTTYYLDVHIRPTTEGLKDINQIIDTIFGTNIKVIDYFELPQLSTEEVIHLEDTWNTEDDYSDGVLNPESEDEELREFDRLTYGLRDIQWERLYPEPNGADAMAFIGVVIASASLVYQFVKDYEHYKREEAWKNRINRLRLIIIQKYGEGRGYIDPSHETERVYNPKYDVHDFVFIQLLDENKQRKIRITPNGKHMELM